MLPLKNGLAAEKHNNGDLIQYQRPLRECTGLHMDSPWKAITLDAELSHLDGTNSSFGELHSLETRRIKTKQWKSQELLMLKTEISTCLTSTEELNNNGTSSTPRTGRVNQLPVNGTETGASLSTKTSTLFPLWDKEDTSTMSQEETSVSRLKMAELPRNGTSISHQELSEADQPTNPLKFTTLVNPITCNTTQPHQDGGKCSSTRADTSEI